MMATLLHNPVARVDRADGLAAIQQPECALALWERALPDTVVEHLARLDPASVDDIDAVVRAECALLEAAVLLGASGYARETAVLLAREIDAMATLLARIEPVEHLRIRLEIVETDACRRFHADLVTLRLLVTLYGAGTQWIQRDDPATIAQVPTGSVGIFKGRLRIEQPSILHRSPPIAGTNQHRLVLAIDPV